MEPSPDDCEVKETYIPGQQYSCMLLYGEECVAIADLSATTDFRIDGKIYPGMYFNRIKVREKYQGNGLGSFTLEKVLDFAREHNLPIINEMNPYGPLDLQNLTKFFVRHGFKQIKKGVVYFTP